MSSVAASALTPAVTANPDSVVTATKLTLSTGFDNLKLATQGTLTAPIIDNANTFQTGDTLVGSSSDADHLNAVIANSQKFAILATTTGIERIQIQAQGNSLDSTNNNTSVTNQVQIDAQNMLGVTRFENNNSRSDLLIEDVRITSSRTATPGKEADHQEVVLNADRTVNVAATNAAGINGWQVTKDITVAMVSTDPGHVDFGLYFDQNSLRAGNASTSTTTSLVVKLMDIKGAIDTQNTAAPQPLKDNIYNSVTINVDGVQKTINLFAADGKSPVTTSYPDLLTAFTAGIKAAGLEGKITATLGNGFKASSSNINTFGQVTELGREIVLTSTSAKLAAIAGKGFGTDVAAQNSSNYLSEIKIPDSLSSTLTPLVTSTIILDDVGRGSNGGNLVVGGLSIGDTSPSLGVNQFDITVDRNSKLEAITSTNNALKEVYIVNGQNSSNATGIHNGNLTVLGQIAEGAFTSANVSTVAQPVPGMVTANGGTQFNQYGFNDVRVIDASQMKGTITFNAAVTELSINKYLNLTDAAPSVANADNINFVYTGSAQNDAITLALDPKAVAAFTNNLAGREDLTFNVNGGAGSDNLTVGIYTAKDADGNYAPAGNLENWYNNQRLNNNVSVLGGDGEDTIRTPGAGNKNIMGDTAIIAATNAPGSDTIYSDNTGKQVVSNPNNSMVTLSQSSAGKSISNAVWTIGTADGFASDNLNNLRSDDNYSYNLFKGQLSVKFDGYKTANVEIPTTTAMSFVTTDLQINQTIKAAINSDPVLSKLLVAQDGPANTLVITSLIDGVYGAGDISISITPPTEAQIKSVIDGNSGITLAHIYNIQNKVVVPATSNISVYLPAGVTVTNASIAGAQVAANYTGAVNLANDGVNDITGRNSVTTSDNVINAGVASVGLSSDVVVLGTTIGATEQASSNETVVLSKAFGKQVLVHFDATTSAGHDTINFDFFGSAVKYNQVASTSSYDVRVQSSVSAPNDGNLHVIIVDGGTLAPSKVYSVSSGVVVEHGILSVLGLGGQANGGALIPAATLLTNGAFGNFNPSLLPTTPSVSLTGGAAAVNEGTSVTYTATLSSAAPAGGLNIPYQLTGTGIALADFTGTTALTGNIAIAAGTTTGSLILAVAPDNVTEGIENLLVSISAPASGATLGSPSSITTVIADTSSTPSGNALSVAVTATNGATANDATLGNVTYDIASSASNYAYAINGFNAGDKLAFPAGTIESVSNAGTDGNMSIVGTTPLGGQVTINLTGLALSNDTAFNVPSFNTTFGTGSLV